MSYQFHPVTCYKHSFSSPSDVRRKRPPFNDKRLLAVYEHLSEKIVSKQSITVHKVADGRAEAAKYYRFYGNDKVQVAELIKRCCTLKADLSDTEVLCVSDSSSVNLSTHQNRIQDIDQLGVLNDGQTKGFHLHASIALNAKDGSVIGLTDAIYWNRTQKAEEKLAKKDKESRKWYLGAYNSQACLRDANATHINFVFDREADDFTLMEQISQDLNQDFVIRCKHNRRVIPLTIDGAQTNVEPIKVQAHLTTCEVATSYEVDLPALNHHSSTNSKRVKRAARKATLELRYAKVKVLPPRPLRKSKPLILNVIHIREVTEGLPANETPLQWTLWTTRSINSAEDAMRCVQFYLWRWVIEQLFRTIKIKGFNQEATELETTDAILKQTTMNLDAATQVMQLVSARNQEDAPPIDYIFDEKEQALLRKINEQMQGNTKKQQNPFPPDKLSWAAWVIARLGGWKGYQSQRPPGPIIMKRGLERFKTYWEAALLLGNIKVE